MNNRPESQSIGWNLGILSGLFAALQVLISASAARANIATIESMRWALSRADSGGGNPLPLIGPLVQVALIAYGAMIVTGAISLGLCWYAGRLTAYVNGRRTGGAGAGFRVALLSGIIWIVFGIIISLLMRADGTITGVVTSTHDGSALPLQLGGLLIQQLVFGAIGLGLGAWAGHIGASGAPLPTEATAAVPAFALPAAYGMYPVYPPVATHPAYPIYGAYPIAAPPYAGYAPYAPPQYTPPPGSMPPPQYPPPPDYYRASTTTPMPAPAPQEPRQEPGQTVVESPSTAEPASQSQPPVE